MRKITLLLILMSLHVFRLAAEEGMWLPLLLKQMKEKDMIAAGMKMTAEDLYSVNNSSLKDAVVQFGRGCTGEIISNQGLLLTNHHCGYGQIQDHSSVENDYLKNGFWAKDKKSELPNPGLTATFIIRIDDVSRQILEKINSNMSETEREKVVSEVSSQLVKEATAGTHYDAFVRPMFNGNEYYLFVTEVFRDIRLVGAPTANIGAYGKDTDNWTWPRHAGDFSLFRIYAGKDNKPADYSPDNVPFKPRKHLKINIGGIRENDFTLVYGFPGRTNEYLTSTAVKYIIEKGNPMKVDLRDKRLKIMKNFMDSDRKIFIQYADKYSGVSNYHKKWTGETKGLLRADVLSRKKEQEEVFLRKVNANPEWHKYQNLLAQLQAAYDEINKIQPEVDLFNETVFTVECLRFAMNYRKLASLPESALETDEAARLIADLKSQAETFFRDYHAPLDRQMFGEMLHSYYQLSSKPAYISFIPDTMRGIFRANTSMFTDRLFDASIFTNEHKVNNILSGTPAEAVEKIKSDPIFLLADFYAEYYRDSVYSLFAELNNRLIPLNRTYMQALREVNADKKFYPDANSTLRVTYGKVEGYAPSDTSFYPWYTTADQIIAKYESGNPDYEKDEKLFELIRKKDFGRYGKKGQLNVCFAASNHTTGGNSGSPVLNAKGELIGTNFDRNWEGTMSDIYYDINQVRNIAMDARYMMFIIDKYAGAKHLIKEMTIVKK